MRTEVFTERRFYTHTQTQMPLRTDVFLHRETLHTDAWFTQRRFYKENLLRTDAFKIAVLPQLLIFDHHFRRKGR